MPKLYPFQEELVNKLGDPKIIARLIGDEMGTGKTFEGVAIDKKLRGGVLHTMHKTLIIAPRGVHEPWRDVIKLFIPNAKVMIIDRKKRAPFVMAIQADKCTHFICHYEAMRLMPELKKVRFFHIILDETHRIKNRKTQQTRAIKALKTVYKTSMSGSPADDKPEDLWSTLNFLYPGQFSSFWRFVNEVCEVTTEEGRNGAKFQKIDGVKIDPTTGEKDQRALKHFHATLEPFYMRRTKEEVLPDLPDKYYSQIYVDLPPPQRRVYDQMRRDMLTWIGEHEDEPLSAPVVIAQLIRLQQAALGMLEWYETGRMVQTPAGMFVEGGLEQWKPERKIRIVEPSVKLDTLVQTVEDERIDPFVLFSQSKSMIKLAVRRLTAEGHNVAEFTGDTPDNLRPGRIAGFQNGEYNVFAATIATGGEGITLTRASTCFFFDRTWNPSRNRQAEDRLHRIGQKNAVHIVDFMATDTVDLRVRDTNINKWSSIRALLGDTHA